mgnify:CR=1 FL=1|tara:strand:+ start:4709 stop:5134 length:426 start_codon:yes stop_codon:yes gene_type:complete
MIRVQFDKNGFYHPAFGRLGRGEANKGRIYGLPDQFGETEEIEVDLMDHTSRPARKVGVRKVTRRKYLPTSAVIVDDERMEEIVEDALEANEAEPKVTRPKVTDKDALDTITGRGKVAKAQTGADRTALAGPKPRARRVAK